VNSLKLKSSILLLGAALALPTVAAATGPAIDTESNGLISNVERRVLAPNIAEYSFTFRVGSGPYDEIGIHRVVKESSPNVPVRARNAVFLAPGDIWNFRAAFLTGSHPMPVFLAENGVDVWGIDYRWTAVPLSAGADLGFMKNWTLEQDARDLGVAIGVARVTRAFTGSGFGKISLLGWSRGGQISYAYLNAESQLPPGLRQVKGFIPTDIYLKTDDLGLRAVACAREDATEAALAGGAYAAGVGALSIAVGNDALANPSAPSTNLPGTNREAGLLIGEATFALLGGAEPAPAYHFTGGTFAPPLTPTGLLYSNETDLFRFEAAASPFQPNRELADADAAVCEATDVAFDDHLGDITVPVLYIGAGGGFGEFGIYTTTLLGSTDVTTLVVHKVPASQRLADYGHADLFLANDAQTLVWQPLLNWLQAH
jgi:pimeloyl-ACP methyl ester carboxylesterase